MTYELKGSILEVCDCNVLCPCWIGEDPDGGTCDASLAYHIDEGSINGIDVSGRTIANIVHIPGNILQGNIRGIWFVDDGASSSYLLIVQLPEEAHGPTRKGNENGRPRTG